MPAFTRFPDMLAWCRSFRANHGKDRLRDIYRADLSDPIIFEPAYCDSCSEASLKLRTLHTHRYYTHRSLFHNQEILLCPQCDRCNHCCERKGYCFDCSGCEGRLSSDNTSTCENCEVCHDCCSCSYCEGCSNRVRAHQFHSDCERCLDCCSDNGNCNDDESRCPVEFIERIKPTFHAAKRTDHKLNPSRRFVAVEIEVAKLNDPGSTYRFNQAIAKWRAAIVQDASLPSTGFEVNTAPASGDKFNQQIGEICDGLVNADAEVDKSCGLHVHIDARDFSYYDIRRLTRLYATIEQSLFDMVPKSRKASNYCIPCGARFLEAIEAGRMPYDKVKKEIATTVYGQPNTKNRRNSKYDSARYAALNLHSWFFRGTVECRMFNGSVNASKITAWGMLWQTILDTVAASTDDQIASLCRQETQPCFEANRDRSYRVLTTVANSQLLRSFINERIALHGGYQPPSTIAVVPDIQTLAMPF